ncbi:hypothetical protein [Methylobacterium aquaticum]|uniref:Uncharacterized protein n=1 Tax=Methylobacterium aquaticum TaxID=270351 RepID=A0A0C6FQ17_9HYPH|nr:hypothetical protein [Methylobacterium aquaticum]BAQ50388.1 hypothetical protein Maq22A_4p60165 [Methylobacterium aquaticum]
MGETPIVSRRAFLGLFAAAAASRLVVPAFTPPRAPYVEPGQSVSYVGLNLHPQPTFIGTMRVETVGEWDGIGFPVALRDHGRYGAYDLVPHRFYDADLCDFLRELPRDFWHDRARVAKYPNVHAWVREQRFGEPVSVMRARLAQSWGEADA